VFNRLFSLLVERVEKNVLFISGLFDILSLFYFQFDLVIDDEGDKSKIKDCHSDDGE